MKIKGFLKKSFLATLFLFSMLGTGFASPVKIVAFGDSLMAGYQIAQESSYPSQLAQALKDKGYDIEMTNASVSGDTTSGGLSRLLWSIPEGTDAVILELGANDALRGLPVDITRNNLDEMIKTLIERDMKVMLMGMLAPPNMGEDYENSFNSIYPDLASKYEVPLYPFFLDGVAGIPDLNLADGIHPTPDGVGILVNKTLPMVEAFLASMSAN